VVCVVLQQGCTYRLVLVVNGLSVQARGILPFSLEQATQNIANSVLSLPVNSGISRAEQSVRMRSKLLFLIMKKKFSSLYSTRSQTHGLQQRCHLTSYLQHHNKCRERCRCIKFTFSGKRSKGTKPPLLLSIPTLLGCAWRLSGVSGWVRNVREKREIYALHVRHTDRCCSQSKQVHISEKEIQECR